MAADAQDPTLGEIVPFPTNGARPQVQLNKGRLPEAVDRVADVLRQRAEGLYLQGRRIVRVDDVQHEALGGGATKSLEVVEVSAAEFSIEIDRLVEFRKFDGRTRRLEFADCPRALSAALYDSPRPGLLPRIERIAETPLLTADNRLLTEGVHGTTFVRSPRVELPEPCDRAAAEAALSRVAALIEEFPFATERDRAAGLALLMTAALRPSLEASPGFMLAKNDYGAGASTLAKLAGIVATGRVPAMLGADNPEELVKELTAALMAGRGVIALDNLAEGGEVKGGLLAKVLTEPLVSVRELGKSRNHEIIPHRLVLLTGVNIAPGRDIQRRVLRLTIEPHTETPEARSFRRPRLLEDVSRTRPEVLRDLLTIVVAYREAWQPATVAALAGYDEWASACVAPLVWLGRSDPIAEVLERTAADPTREVLRALLPLLPQTFTVKQLATLPGPAAVLATVGGRDDGSMNLRQIGRFIQRTVGRQVQGRRIIRDGTTDGASRYRIIAVEGVRGDKGLDLTPSRGKCQTDTKVWAESNPLPPETPSPFCFECDGAGCARCEPGHV